MRVAVLSGKGGTGKTLVSVNLTQAAQKATYIDCDVEEPNGHLFFKPENVIEKEVLVKIPQVDPNLCDGCRKCVDFCRFNALAYIRDKLIIFDEVCHSCGGCSLVCPQKAINEKDKAIGYVKRGTADGVQVHTGIMNIGEAAGIPIIADLLTHQETPDHPVTIIDCPPGSSCSVMESIQDADYCILVAEPTLFGVHNLNMVYELVKLFNKPYGVVLNKCLEGENPAEDFCLEHQIPILTRIPFDPKLGRINAQAQIIVKENADYQQLFADLLDRVKEEVAE